MQIYVPELSKYGSASIVKLTVRETPKLYIVEEKEHVLGHGYSYHVGSHIHKGRVATCKTVIEALEYLAQKASEREEYHTTRAREFHKLREEIVDSIMTKGG